MTKKLIDGETPEIMDFVEEVVEVVGVDDKAGQSAVIVDISQPLEVITGDLRAYAQLVPGTFQHWDELSAAQINDASLRTQGFYVADYPQYHLEKGKPLLALARHTKTHPNNLVLNHLFDSKNSSYEQLVNNNNFFPDLDEARAILQAADTLITGLRDLRLSGTETEYRYLAICTADGYVKVGDRYHRPTGIEQELILRAGYTEQFLDVLKNEYNISETKLYVLAPDYVVNVAGEKFVGRAAWRGDFGIIANSLAIDHGIGSHGGLFGVRRGASVSEPGVAVGDASENIISPSVPSVPSETRFLTVEEVLVLSKPYIPSSCWSQWQEDLQKKFKH